MMFRNNFEIDRIFINILGKLANPISLEISSKEIEKALNELTCHLISYIKKCQDLVVIGAALEAITDIFHDKKFNFLFLGHDVFKILYEGIPKYRGRVDKLKSKLQPDDLEYCEQCIRKVTELLSVKQCDESIDLKGANRPLLSDYDYGDDDEDYDKVYERKKNARGSRGNNDNKRKHLKDE